MNSLNHFWGGFDRREEWRPDETVADFGWGWTPLIMNTEPGIRNLGESPSARLGGPRSSPAPLEERFDHRRASSDQGTGKSACVSGNPDGDPKTGQSESIVCLTSRSPLIDPFPVPRSVMQNHCLSLLR